MDIRGLQEYIEKKINKHPDIAEQIQEFYQLALDEIEQGESTQNEIYLCVDSIEDLIKENSL